MELARQIRLLFQALEKDLVLLVAFNVRVQYGRYHACDGCLCSFVAQGPHKLSELVELDIELFLVLIRADYAISYKIIFRKVFHNNRQIERNGNRVSVREMYHAVTSVCLYPQYVFKRDFFITVPLPDKGIFPAKLLYGLQYFATNSISV